jgi:probable rRNA maturation factor
MTGRKPEVHVDDESHPDAPVELIERAVRLVLESEGRDDVDVSVAFLDDPDMRRLNSEYLGRDRTTDVMAFSLPDEDGPTLGDIYLGWEQAGRQAEALGLGLREELARLAIHGTLHVLGHDHPEGPEREHSAMFRLQERLLAQLLSERGASQ